MEIFESWLLYSLELCKKNYIYWPKCAKIVKNYLAKKRYFKKKKCGDFKFGEVKKITVIIDIFEK